jgi:hypothetical protein
MPPSSPWLQASKASRLKASKASMTPGHQDSKTSKAPNHTAQNDITLPIIYTVKIMAQSHSQKNVQTPSTTSSQLIQHLITNPTNSLQASTDLSQPHPTSTKVAPTSSNPTQPHSSFPNTPRFYLNQSHVTQLGPIWTNLILMNPIWSLLFKLDSLDPSWSHQKPLDPLNWSSLCIMRD